jgi:hypothetical protein
MRAALAGTLSAGFGAILVAALSSSAAGPGFLPIEVHAQPIREFRIGQPSDRFGALEFRGGLTLSSANPDFGSWSGLDFSADGKTIYAVSDNGIWFTARLVQQDGRLVGIDNPMLAPMLDDDGGPLVGKAKSDAEGLRIAKRDGVDAALVSFEQVADVRAFAVAPDLALATPSHVTLPKPVHRVAANQGLEAIAVAPSDSRLGGATVVIAERSLDQNGNHRGFVLDGPLAGSFSVRRTGDFDVTDAAFLMTGDLLILERRFRPSEGIAMRIRRIAGPAIAPHATVDGPALIEADTGYQIDNMEGLAVRLGEDGQTLVNLISDDNHNLLQRTVLLQFVLRPAAPPLPRLRPQASALSP